MQCELKHYMKSCCVLYKLSMSIAYVFYTGVLWELEKLCFCHLVGSMPLWLLLILWCSVAISCTSCAYQCNSGTFSCICDKWVSYCQPKLVKVSDVLLKWILHTLYSSFEPVVTVTFEPQIFTRRSWKNDMCIYGREITPVEMYHRIFWAYSEFLFLTYLTQI